MNIDVGVNSEHFSEAIEEPLMIFLGEGSGEELKVGNEEKKKIFFFGQPGCLKHSPIRTNTPENHNNHDKQPDGASVATKLFPETEKSKTPKKEASDDDDNSELLQRITDAINDGKDASADPEKPESPKPSETIIKDETTMMIDEQANQPNDSSKLDVSEKVYSISEGGDNKSSTIVEDSLKTKDSSSNSKAIDSKEVPQTASGSENVSIPEKNSENVGKEIKLGEYKSTSVQIIMKSIVPYDDDSTSSSSQAETEKVKEAVINDDNTSEPSRREKSASKSPEQDIKLDAEPNDELEGEKEVHGDPPIDLLYKSLEPSTVDATQTNSENETIEVSEKPVATEEEDFKASTEHEKVIFIQEPNPQSPIRSPSPEVQCKTIEHQEHEAGLDITVQKSVLTDDSQLEEIIENSEKSTICQSTNKEQSHEPEASQLPNECSSDKERVEVALNGAKKSTDQQQSSPANLDVNSQDSTHAETIVEEPVEKELSTEALGIEEKSSVSHTQDTIVESQELNEKTSEECEMKLPEIINNEEAKTSIEEGNCQIELEKSIKIDLEVESVEASHETSAHQESQSPALLQENDSVPDEKSVHQPLESQSSVHPSQNEDSLEPEAVKELHTEERDEEIKVEMKETIDEPTETILSDAVLETSDSIIDPGTILNHTQNVDNEPQQSLQTQILSETEMKAETQQHSLDLSEDLQQQPSTSSEPCVEKMVVGALASPRKSAEAEILGEKLTLPASESSELEAVAQPEEPADDENLSAQPDIKNIELENSQKAISETPITLSKETLSEKSQTLPKADEESSEIQEEVGNVADIPSQSEQTFEEPTCITTEKEEDLTGERPVKDVADTSLGLEEQHKEQTIENQENQKPKQPSNDEEDIDSSEDLDDYQDEATSDVGSELSEREDEDEKPHQDVKAVEATITTEVQDEYRAPLELSMSVKAEEDKKFLTTPGEVVEPITSLERIEKHDVNDLPTETISTETIAKAVPEDTIVKTLAEVETVEEPAENIKPAITRKRKMSERKSISESDSEGNNVADSASNVTDDEEVVVKKKPRMRGKTTQRKVLPARKSARNVDESKKNEIEVKAEIEKKPYEPLTAHTKKEELVNDGKKALDAEQTLQNFKFDYDESEDIAAKVAAIRTMISKEPAKETTSDKSEDEDSERKVSNKRTVRTKRGRTGKKNEVESSSDEDCAIKSEKMDTKRSKTSEESKDQQSTSAKKKRETGPKGLLKYIDTSLVIETVENEAPVRMSRRIAQQKIREETERRQMEEKMLKQMKAEAEKKKKGSDDEDDPDADVEDHQKDSSGDESFKGSPRKKKSKIKASDKQWQTSSSHSEHSESEDYLEHVPSDPGSPLFRSDHEFSPESDDDDATQVQPLKRARTAKKLGAVASSDEDEDINPNHACQVCHKTDSPEWILLCDECDCGYHCSCLKPIIFLIPSGNWFCPLCCQKKLVTSLEDQLTQIDTMIHNIETAELRRQRQQLAEITEQNILQERRKNSRLNDSREKSVDSRKSSGSSESDESSEDAPLKDYFYKLRKRNEKAAPSYRFNEYDDLMNHAINRGMDDKGAAGNLGRGKDISTIIEAEDDNEEEKQNASETEKPASEKNDGGESSGSDVIRPKKISKRKKRSRKLNQLDVSSEEERVSDVDFKGTSSSDSEVDEEDLSMSSVSESSLDLPSKKGRSVRKSTRTRAKRVDRRFINDNDSDSDDEPLIKAKRTRKKNDSDEEDFDLNEDEDDEGSLAEEIDSEDLCDDTDTDDSSEGNWPRKKKKRVAAYDIKPRKAPKKNDDEDKAFRAGISKKKVLKKSDNESDASVSESEKGKRKTRGKKLLYLIEDDLDSDESDGIKPGVKRPETPPEEREMFVKKQEEIKRMLAAKDTEAAKKLAAPTIEPIHFALEKPHSPPPIPFSNEPASLSTIPKNVIESAKALDTDYNRIKPIAMGSQAKGNDGSLQSNDMNEEELARMMEEEDFAQHQLKLAGEAIARSKKLLELEAKEGEFAAYTKVNKEKEWVPPVESKKRSRKSKSSEKTNESFPGFSKSNLPPQAPLNQSTPPMPPLVSSNVLQMPKSLQQQMPSHPSMLANLIQQQSGFPPSLTSMANERPSVLSSFLTRPEMHPQLLKMHQPIPPEAFNQKIQHIPTEAYNLKTQQVLPESFISKNQQLPSETFDPKHQQQFEESEEKKKGRRKKFTPLRTDLIDGNLPKQAKFDQPSVIMPTNPAARNEDKSKAPRPDHPKLAVAAPPQIFNLVTNPTPSVITRLLQPQQRPGPGTYPQAFTEAGQPVGGNPGPRPFPEDLKNMSPNKIRAALQQPPMGSGLPPQGSFGENPFVPRNLHQLYRGPPGYGVIPPHARLPPYPFHHLHPNLRPEYSAPYNIPPQFSYYAPPAHSRQPPQPSAIPLNHGASQLVAAGSEEVANSIRNANNSEEPSETSEFGGLVSYFSSQQELD